jgi:GntR family transcriptional repressor for pyruvate dehydrogenase complex
MLRPIKTEKLYNIIIRRIFELISDEKLGPGDRLPSERELALALSVSRASVRQAITALSAKGVLVMRQGDGTYVSDPKSGKQSLELFSQVLAGSQIDPDEILEVRLIVECESARLCALRADDNHIKKMRDILDQKKVADKLEGGVKLDLNRKFHLAIAEGVQNKALLHITEALWEIMRSNMWPLIKNESKDRATQLKIHRMHHEEILNAVGTHDPERAFKAMYTHLTTIKNDVDEYITLTENNQLRE